MCIRDRFGNLLFGFYWGLCCGGSVFIAQYHGVNDEDGIRRAYGLTTVCMICLLYTSWRRFLLRRIDANPAS